MSTNNAWNKWAAREGFVAWVEVDGVDTDRARYAVIKPDPWSAFKWVRLYAAGIDKIAELDRSQGMFYDGVEEHPEGALAWASNAARRDWQESREILREMGIDSDV